MKAISVEKGPRILAVCTDCDRAGRRPIIGSIEVKGKPSRVQLSAHGTIWQGHCDALGHHVTVVEFSETDEVPHVREELGPYGTSENQHLSFVFRRA